MKLIEWFRKKVGKQKKTEELLMEEEAKENSVLEEAKIEEASPVFQKEKVKIENKEERERYVRNCCEQMLEASDETENAKLEYSLVTAYLKDMQMIEEMPDDRKTVINTTVRKILNLNEERKNLQKTVSKITDMQYWFAENHENEIPDILKRMTENEKYREVLKSDMRHLENEKAAQNIRKRDILQEQQNLKGMSVIAFATLIAAIILIIAFQMLFDAEVKLAYMVSMFAAVLVTTGLYLKLKNADYELKYTELCINKAIGLLNKTKIKYVNIVNALDYTYEKYNVKSAYELNYIWENYMKEREERYRYQRASDDLEFYNEQLVKQLREFGIQDASVWPSQVNAIVDSKEMVEIRHRLIRRRQKIRKQLDYNQKIMEDAKSEISNLINTHKEYAKEILEIVNSVEGN
ncbi:MAG: hypothetical protein IJA36_06880 [Lachnospiraceae bacterium]|nr:hypothetical protein [Lachnospiraceae bacterium]